MPFVDMTIAGGRRGAPPPGTYRIRVKAAEFKKSSNGSAMFSVELLDDATGEKLAYDNIMLEGGGWGLGQSKLLALGIGATFKGELAAADLVNRKAWAVFVPREYTDRNGCLRQGLQVDINQGSAGYWPIESPPADLTQRLAATSPAVTADPSADVDAPF